MWQPPSRPRGPEVRARPRATLKVTAALSGHAALQLLAEKYQQKQQLAEKQTNKLECVANKKAEEEMNEER